MYEKLFQLLYLHALHFQTRYDSPLHDRISFRLLYSLPLPQKWRRR